jgi:hypothetical protein
MKKIFTSCAVLAAGIALAQAPMKPLAPKKVNDQVMINPGQVGHGTGTSNRVQAFFNDFSTPSDWTLTNASSPSQDWEIVSTLPTGLTSQSFGPTVNSTSGGNFALINSDGAGGTATQDANLTTTNSFSCSANPSVQVRFENYHRIYQEQHFVLVSTDGVNFDSYEVNTNYGANNGNYTTSPNVEETSINVSATAANQPAVWLRFNYQGNYDWFWVIDDVYVEDAPNDNMTLTGGKVYNATWDPLTGVPHDYYIVPAAQIDDQIIIADLNNLGATANTNAALDVDVTGSVSGAVFSGSTTPTTLAVSTSMTDSVTWATSSTQETYTIDYAGTHDNIGTNASAAFTGTREYIVGPNSGAGAVYARDNNTPTGAGLWNGAGNGYIMGNSFMVNSTVTAFSIDVSFTTSTDPGVVACIILYEIDPGTGDFIPLIDQCLDGVEYTLQAANISTATTLNFQSFKLNASAPLTGYTLNAGTHYIAAINHYGGTEDMVIQNGGTSVDGFATWLYDQTDATWYYMTTKPKIRLGLDNTVSFLGVNETEFTNLSLSQNIPNPANETATINYSLVEGAEVSFEVVDLTGKVVYSEEMGNKGAGVYSVTLNTADYADGIYFYTMTAGADKMTKKMVIAK